MTASASTRRMRILRKVSAGAIWVGTFGLVLALMGYIGLHLEFLRESTDGFLAPLTVLSGSLLGGGLGGIWGLKQSEKGN